MRLALKSKLKFNAAVVVAVAFGLVNLYEAVVNLASPQKHDLPKKAKDVASAAVFFMLVLFAVSRTVVLCNLYFR